MIEARIRSLDGGDLQLIAPLRSDARSAVSSERGGAALLADLASSDDDSGSDVAWCATLDDVPIGHLVARVAGVGDARVVTIRELWVDPEARGIGAGEGLVSAALAWALAEEAMAIDAYALPGSRETKNLFERLGLTARLLTVRRSLR